VKQYEYRVEPVRINDALIFLNKLGKAGWLLVSSNGVWIFAREIS
jgi:hypothetical protein